MITLTKLNGAQVLVNPDLIRTVEATPDTLIKFVDGETLMVRETVPTLTAKFLTYKHAISSGVGIHTDEAAKEVSPWT